MMTADRFGDETFIEKMMNLNAMFHLTNQRIYQEFIQSDQRKQVVSLIRKFPLLTGQKGLVVVNISTEAIARMAGEMSNSGVSFIDVYDSDGKLLFASGSASDEAGSIKRGTQLTRAHSTYTNWDYRSGLNDEHLFTYASVFSYVWVGLGLLMIVIGGIWITYVTHRNYRPIESIMARISSYSENKPFGMEAKKQDEFQFIERALGNLMERSSQYEKQHEEDIVFRRRHFFMEWLEGNRAIGNEEWMSEMQRLQLTCSFEHLTAAVVELDKYMEVCRMFSHRDQELLKFVLSRVVYETAEQLGMVVWAEWTANHRLGVAIFTNKDAKSSEKQAANLCESVRSWVEQNLHFRITIGLGQAVNQVQELVHSYDEAVNALRYKTTLGANRVIYYWESEGQAETEVYKHLSHVKTMAQSFRLGEKEWKEELERIFAELKTGLFTRDEIHNLMNYMVYHLNREMMELSNKFQDMWKLEALPRLNDVMEQFDTIEEVYNQWFVILDDVSERMVSLRESRSMYALINNIRSYMEENFADPELSLSSLSDQFHVHASHLSRAFKEELGEKFVDYLAKIRMEQAKKLLGSNVHSVQDIAVKVGYTHAISFIRAFKKYSGITPGDYRNT
jgi:AraC-like DNA-binding protein